jgi:hypothetical protein
MPETHRLVRNAAAENDPRTTVRLARYARLRSQETREHVMNRSYAGLLVLASAVTLVGCATWDDYVQSGNPWEEPPQKVYFEKADFDRVEVGMSHGQVLALLGEPTDVSKNVMHWDLGEYRNAWVFLNARGSRVTSKYWQDEETLRLGEIKPLLH